MNVSKVIDWTVQQLIKDAQSVAENIDIDLDGGLSAINEQEQMK
jgi:hypothetical protein